MLHTGNKAWADRVVKLLMEGIAQEVVFTKARAHIHWTS